MNRSIGLMKSSTKSHFFHGACNLLRDIFICLCLPMPFHFHMPFHMTSPLHYKEVLGYCKHNIRLKLKVKLLFSSWERFCETCSPSPSLILWVLETLKWWHSHSSWSQSSFKWRDNSQVFNHISFFNSSSFSSIPILYKKKSKTCFVSSYRFWIGQMLPLNVSNR